MVYDLFGSVKSLVKLDNYCIDNNVFRLHYKATVIFLVAFSLLVTSNQYFGDPIDCIQRDDIPPALLDTYCWIHSTFTLPEALNKKVGVEVPHPGIDKYTPGEKRVYHKYYQWVCFVLFLQAIMFYLPRYLWKMWEGGRVRSLILNLDAPILTKQARDEASDHPLDPTRRLAARRRASSAEPRACLAVPTTSTTARCISPHLPASPGSIDRVKPRKPRCERMARTSSAVLEDGAKGGAAAPANATARRKQIQSVVLLLFALGALSVVVRVADLSVYSSATTSTSASRAAGLAQMRSASRVATPLKAKSNASVVTEESPKMKAARLEQLAAMIEAVGVQRPAHQYDSKTREMCFRERDVGMLEAIRGSAKEFCGQASAADGALPKRSPSAATAVTLYRVRGGIKSAVLENVMVDLTDAEIFHPIKSMAEDGGSHDPRFKFNPRLVNCACKELADHYLAMSEPQRAHDHLWTPSVADIPDSEATPMSLLCAPKPESVFTDGSDVSTWDFVRHPDAPPNASAAVVFEDPVIMIARRDDHNPFFQISYALNAWVMVQALGWDLARTRVLHFDAGYPSPIDALHQKLFSDDRPLMEAHQMMGKQLHFKNQVLVAPFELSGPMMQHLDDEEPCYDSEMLKKFRELSLTSQGITPTVVADLAVTKVRPFTVTIITRKPYDGRKLQRVWLNEDEVVGKMRAEYSGLNVEFRSIDYVLLSLEEQMRTTLESDLVIGMHGAGMVNVMWARPEAVIVEIFPKERFRWGYRNLCQFLGCHWHEFRGGEDLGDNPTPNTKDKNIPYDEWMAFFHPLFRDAYSVFDEKQRVLQHQLEGI